MLMMMKVLNDDKSNGNDGDKIILVMVLKGE